MRKLNPALHEIERELSRRVAELYSYAHDITGEYDELEKHDARMAAEALQDAADHLFYARTRSSNHTRYLAYLTGWVNSHRSSLYEGMSPTGYEEWLENEAAEEDEDE